MNQTKANQSHLFLELFSLKKLFAILLLLSMGTLLAQDENKNTPFSNINLGVYGGINFAEVSEVGGAFNIEWNTNLTSNLNLRLSLGYYKSIESVDYTVRSSGETTIDSITYFIADSYDVTHWVYDVLPISLGLQYVFKNETISPYLLLDGNYNFINLDIVRTGGESRGYPTYEEIPDEYKVPYVEIITNNFFGASVGMGVLYNIKKNLDLDFRYLFKYSAEIINSHQFLVGITF